jgi:uncharacterized protein YfaP (DUF2135 family)
VCYSAFELRHLVAGPTITLETPYNGQSFTDHFIEISGAAKNVTFLYINGNQIYTDATGHFSEHFILQTGYNIITVEALGRFKRTVQKTIAVVGL